MKKICIAHKDPVEFSDKDLDALALKFKALSEPSRLKILNVLFDGEKTVNEIVDLTGLMQANASKQLKSLAKSNIVQCRPDGLCRYYSITDTKIKQMCAIVCEKI